jgi:hypothetical protein
MRILPILLLLISPALAHDGYTEWRNQIGELCCEDFHCRTLDDSEVRTSGQNVYVKIADEWCEIKSWHRARGSSPDWSHAHLCLWPGMDLLPAPKRSPCDRIICFMPKPDF